MRDLRTLLGLAALIGTIPFIQNCSDVHFSTRPVTGCSLSNPCVGPDGRITTEQTFPFNGSNKIDVLFVDDNSSSMGVDQQSLANAFTNFISKLNGTDWQIAVTNTDTCFDSTGFKCTPFTGGRGQFMGPQGVLPMYSNSYVLTTSTPNVNTVFGQTIQRNLEQGARDERGLKAAWMAIDNQGGAGFFRTNSQFALVILSDEDERSTGGLMPDGSQCSVPGQGGTQCAPLETEDLPVQLIGKVNNPATWADGRPRSFRAHSLVILPGDSGCLNAQINQAPGAGGAYGTVYADLSERTGGIKGSICDNGSGSFSNTLGTIGDEVRDQANSRIITLAYIPDSPPTVTFNPTSAATSYTWTPGTRTITLAVAPPTGTIVTVRYTYNPNSQ